MFEWCLVLCRLICFEISLGWILDEDFVQTHSDMFPILHEEYISLVHDK